MSDDERRKDDLLAEIRELRALVTELTHRDESRKRTEQALVDSRNTLQLVMDTIPQRVFWKDREFRYLGCNAVFARDAGLSSSDEIVGKHDFDLPWRETAALYRSDDKLVMEGREAKINYEEPQSRPDGSVRWLRTTKVPLLDHDGDVIGIFGCYEDVTERRKAEEALRESEERYRTLIEQAADGIMVADAEGRFIQVNGAASEITGYSSEQLLDMTVWDLVDGEDQRQRPTEMERLRDGATVIEERRLRRGDGSIVNVEVSAKMLSDGRVQSTVRDVSERMRALEEKRLLEEQLQHAQRLESLGRLAGGVAHDFNNLLTAILTNCDMLRIKLARQDLESREVEQIHRASRRAAALTGQLLSFSRKQVIQPRVVDLDEIVRDTQSMLARLIGEHIDLEVRLAGERCLAEADPGQLDQILVNLVVNARDAMRDGGRLTISTRVVTLDEETVRRHPGVAPGRFVELRVSDTGEGMSPDTLEHLFEPFFTTKEHGKGTGLGLATVYGIVRRASGAIEVETALGKGTTVSIYLPQSEGPIAPAHVIRPEAPEKVEGRTILLVEDEDSVRDSASRILTEGGYRVLCASDGEEALRLYDENAGKIDLVLTDVVMPRMGGPELAREIRDRTPGVKLLFVSGYTDDTLGERGVVSPDIELLHKPFSRVPLLDKVRQVLASHR